MTLRQRSAVQHGWLIVGATTSVTFLFAIFYSFGVFLGPLIAEFGWSSTLTSFVFSVFCVSYSVAAILVGKFTDRYGPRGTIGLAGAVTALALLLSSRANAVWQLYLTFGVMGGVGAGTFWTPPMKAVMEEFQSSKSLNLAVSIVSVGTGAGMLLISPLAGLFIVDYGWRICYILFALISAAVCVFAVLIIHNPKGGVGHSTGVDREPSDQSDSGLSGALKTRNFWSLLCTQTLGSGIARFTVLVYLVAFLMTAGFSLELGALCVGLIGAGTVFGRIFSGLLSVRLRENHIMSASYVVQGLATIIFILSRSVWVVAVSAVVFGIGYGGYVPQYPILTRESFGMKSYGLVYGSISSGLGVGSLIGPPILGGYLLAVTGNYVLTFVLAASFSLVAGGTALLIRSPEALRPLPAG